jgi:hypothetical protein
MTTTKHSIKDIVGYNQNHWFYIKNILNSITHGRFSCFFENKILNDECFFVEFA